MNSKLNVWLVLFLTGLAAHETIDVFIRPEYGIGEGTIPYLLGIAPNFLAAALIFPFAVLTFRDYYTNDLQQASASNLSRWFWAGVLGTQIGLITWEFLQKSGKLVFDMHDISATIAGGITAVGIYLLSRYRYLERVGKTRSAKKPSSKS